MRVPQPKPVSIERLFVARRAVRLDAVLRELRRTASRNPAPRLVGGAIQGFEADLAAVRHQLSRQTGGPAKRGGPAKG